MKSILSVNQILNATIWLKAHRKHVYELVFNARDEFQPTELEDKDNPDLWKPEHWKWFLNNT